MALSASGKHAQVAGHYDETTVMLLNSVSAGRLSEEPRGPLKEDGWWEGNWMVLSYIIV